jgi:tetratricopeptide (TPR) repeat protein
MGHGGVFSAQAWSNSIEFMNPGQLAIRMGEGLRGMNVVQILDRFINWPSQTALAVAFASASVLAITGLLLAVKKWKWFGRFLGLLGFLIIMGSLIVVHEQTRTEKNQNVRVTRYRYSERTRLWAIVALGALPVATAAVMWVGFVKTRRRLRGEVPHHLKLGRKHLAQRDYEAALRDYNRAIHAAPHLAEAYCKRGSIYQALGKPEQALSDFDQAIERDPRLAAAYLERGKMRTARGDHDAALADFGQLMLIRANDPDSYLHRGICLARKGLVDDALADFHRVLKLTNHSDFAEPAKDLIRQLLDRQGNSPLANTNGMQGMATAPKQHAQDRAI